nr:ferritin-like protein 2 [Phoronopsis harmeri]
MSCCVSERTDKLDFSCSISPSRTLINTSINRMSVSQCRQNYHEQNEAGINKQINLELYASYTYQSMAFYFDRDDVALKGFYKYFKHASDEEREHAEKMMKFQNQRGGRIVLQDIKKPEKDEWTSGLAAMQAALELEKNVNQSLLDLHKLASNNGDAQMCDWIESNFLTEQVEAIKEIGGHIINLKRVGTGLGEFMFDKQTLDS